MALIDLGKVDLGYSDTLEFNVYTEAKVLDIIYKPDNPDKEVYIQVNEDNINRIIDTLLEARKHLNNTNYHKKGQSKKLILEL